jgi:hypothetical protein
VVRRRVSRDEHRPRRGPVEFDARSFEVMHDVIRMSAPYDDPGFRIRCDQGLDDRRHLPQMAHSMGRDTSKTTVCMTCPAILINPRGYKDFR